MTKLNFDELNKLYTEYFEVMDISNEQKLERIELAELLDDVFLFLFVYLDSALTAGSFNIDIAYDLAQRRYIDVLEEYGINFSKYPDIEDYAIEMSKNLVDSTVREYESRNSSIDNNDGKIKQRVIDVAQNEANTVFNRMEYDDAVTKGYKYKTWITEGDTKVRHTHRNIDMDIKPIDEPFLVGESQMMFPKDTSLGASVREIANCRCGVSYSK